MVHSFYSGNDTEVATTIVTHAAVRAALRAGKDVICDDTNLNTKTVKKLFKLAEQSGASVIVHDFDVSIDECIDRDDLRHEMGDRSVGTTVIDRMHERYIKSNGGKFPKLPPSYEVRLRRKYIAPQGDPRSVVIVDLDGTLAHNDGHRSFYDYTKVYDDKVHGNIHKLVSEFYELGYHVIFVSGREDSCRADTIKWLDDKCRFGPWMYALFMRETGDGRDDSIVKLEIFDREIRDRYNVRYVLDDRNRVVEMWREIGLTCLQVADGEF